MAALALERSQEMSQERDREAVSWVEVFETTPEGEVGLIWQHPETCDTWRGALENGLPAGPGVYIFCKTKLCVEATVIQRPREDDLVFSGHAYMTWPDGASYDGELVECRMHGLGKFVFNSGDIYEGSWKNGCRHGTGTMFSWSPALLDLSAVEFGKRAYALRYCGEWQENKMCGKGVVEYFDAPPCSAAAGTGPAKGAVFDEIPPVASCLPLSFSAAAASKVKDVSPSPASHRCSPKRLPSDRELLRRFEGLFKEGFPTSGSLRTRSLVPASDSTETFSQVHFDGATQAGKFATWYWTGSDTGEQRGSSLVELSVDGEEHASVASRFFLSMKAVSGIKIDSIQRVENNDMRVIYDMQRRVIEKKVTAPPRSSPWNPATMERWAFHAPVRPPGPSVMRQSTHPKFW
jgi:hypothetical protein